MTQRRARMRALGLAALLCCLIAPPIVAQAQTGNPPNTAAQSSDKKKPDSEKPPAPAWTPPPYEARLLRLSELMGALSYLQRLCASGEGAEWRKSMQQLLQAEGKTDAQKARLAGAFNAGFQGYQLNHRTCTNSSRLIISRFLQEGEKIAREVANRYGSG